MLKTILRISIYNIANCFCLSLSGVITKLVISGNLVKSEYLIAFPKKMTVSKICLLNNAGSIIVPFFLALVAVALYFIYQKKKIEEENQVKIERFLADYEAFKPTRYSYVDIKRITNQFRDELGQGAYGTVYRGNLSNEILVVVKVLNNSTSKGEEFINEVGIIGQIHHVNVVRLVGFCADGFRRALVYEFLPNGSLQKFISPG